MTNYEKKYLEKVRQNGYFTLEGNREYWEQIIFSGNNICISYGSTMDNEETGRKEISEEKAILLIKKYHLIKNGFFEIEPESISLEEVFRKIDEIYGTNYYEESV